jgi:hypothetical protein
VRKRACAKGQRGLRNKREDKLLQTEEQDRGWGSIYAKDIANKKVTGGTGNGAGA